jgi:hypothetical protein
MTKKETSLNRLQGDQGQNQEIQHTHHKQKIHHGQHAEIQGTRSLSFCFAGDQIINGVLTILATGGVLYGVK